MSPNSSLAKIATAKLEFGGTVTNVGEVWNLADVFFPTLFL